MQRFFKSWMSYEDFVRVSAAAVAFKTGPLSELNGRYLHLSLLKVTCNFLPYACPAPKEFIPCGVPLHLLNCKLVFRHASNLYPLPGAHFSSSRPSCGLLTLFTARRGSSKVLWRNGSRSRLRVSQHESSIARVYTNNTNCSYQWDTEHLAKWSETRHI